MISLYQIFQGHIDLDISDLFTVTSYSSTRGHSRKLDLVVLSQKISVRAVSDWNLLPDHIVNATLIRLEPNVPA